MIKMEEPIRIVFDIETLGLDPIKDRVTAIGLKTDAEELIITYKDEKRILNEFWDYLAKKKYFRLVGFNSISFDVPFLYLRSFKHNVEVFNVDGRSIDLRLVLNHGRAYAKGKLEEYSKLIGFKTKYHGFSGKHIPLLWKHGKIEELKEYLLQDVRMTHAVLERCLKVGLI